MKKYTMVYHQYIGHGSYVVEFRRIRDKPSNLRRYSRSCGDLHFIISGWPKIVHPDLDEVPMREPR
jgi:hypothetical protein